MLLFPIFVKTWCHRFAVLYESKVFSFRTLPRLASYSDSICCMLWFCSGWVKICFHKKGWWRSRPTWYRVKFRRWKVRIGNAICILNIILIRLILFKLSTLFYLTFSFFREFTYKVRDIIPSSIICLHTCSYVIRMYISVFMSVSGGPNIGRWSPDYWNIARLLSDGRSMHGRYKTKAFHEPGLFFMWMRVVARFESVRLRKSAD